MWNVLLDPLPTNYEGYPINYDFRIGVQMTLASQDPDLTDVEKYATCADLLFGNDAGMMPETQTIQAGIEWFLGGWYSDNKIKTHEQSKVPVMSFDNDQWRIYSAFLSQYRIDLNTASLHYWVFMALLTSLDECAFTRVVDVRQKKIDARWKKENKDALLEAKRRYAINLESEAEEQERQEVINDFLAHAKINRHEEA